MEYRTVINDVMLLLDDRLVSGSVDIQQGRITRVETGKRIEGGHGIFLAADGSILAPGFIDLHCHGGAGGDINDGNRDSYFAMEEFHRRNGVTSFMPSLSVDPMPKLEAACKTARSLKAEDAPGRTEILGIHFESPYINPKYAGCQAVERLLPFNGDALQFIENNRDIISRITLAPELPGVLEAIPLLRQMGIIVSGGHTDADARIFQKAVDLGMTMATHVYNAMAAVHKEGPFRVSGALEAALTDDRLYTEFIADGWHLPVELLQIAWRCKGRERFMLCSDASRAAGYKSAEPLFICGQEAVVENGVAMLKDRSSLASSAVSLDSMVRFLVNRAGFSIPQALNAASAAPACAAGIDDHKGRIAPGYDADLILLDADLRVQKVWCRGFSVCP